ncbi:hypothetical protein [Subtercola lobariae]|uniref:Uncharacterized protein n=1 Tax=Subtercola lobariae TaxID=1588641 RepID=A0A917BBG6_9MICO|nr:hypothetical protein [Subtercola lobariae]GGF34121.1 hypothetical protein GCM10011399_29130 [Subtercola lobariae]
MDTPSSGPTKRSKVIGLSVFAAVAALLMATGIVVQVQHDTAQHDAAVTVAVQATDELAAATSARDAALDSLRATTVAASTFQTAVTASLAETDGFVDPDARTALTAAEPALATEQTTAVALLPADTSAASTATTASTTTVSSVKTPDLDALSTGDLSSYTATTRGSIAAVNAKATTYDTERINLVSAMHDSEIVLLREAASVASQGATIVAATQSADQPSKDALTASISAVAAAVAAPTAFNAAGSSTLTTALSSYVSAAKAAQSNEAAAEAAKAKAEAAAEAAREAAQNSSSSSSSSGSSGSGTGGLVAVDPAILAAQLAKFEQATIDNMHASNIAAGNCVIFPSWCGY